MDTRIFISIVEQSAEDAVEAIRGIDDEGVGIEVRVDAFDPAARRDFDPAEIRGASKRPMLYTRRSGSDRAGTTADELDAALAAGFDLIDVELDGTVPLDRFPADPNRVLLSLHDYGGVPDLDGELERMLASGIPNLKIAVTPQSFDEDRALLERLAGYDGDAGLTLFGMGTNGLYSRTLAPFLGSRFSFVALDERRSAAPGQLTLARAREIWNSLPEEPPRLLFAVAGSPVAHSRSPRIHNGRFRAAAVPAAYGIIETASLAPVLASMERDAPFSPAGLSVTSPLKEELFSEAVRRGWEVAERAQRVGSANTVVRLDGRYFVDNTDLAGFASALSSREAGDRVAILGAGGTARAALIAALDSGLDVTIFNRTKTKADDLARATNTRARWLDELGSKRFEVVIDTLPSAASFDSSLSCIDEGGLLVRAAYDREDDVERRARSLGISVFGAIELLEAQAEEQSRRFIEAAGRKR